MYIKRLAVTICGERFNLEQFRRAAYIIVRQFAFFVVVKINRAIFFQLSPESVRGYASNPNKALCTTETDPAIHFITATTVLLLP